MKIQVISDLHQEFGSIELSFDHSDVVIFAGDVNIGIKGIEWMLKEIPQKQIIYVLGNHEYYKGSYPKTLTKLHDAAKGSNVHVLENESIMIDDVTFHGATLWTDFSLFGNPRTYGMICQEKMNDYKKIRKDPSYSKLRSIDTYRIHNESISWLEKSLSDSKNTTNIVVTHHAPSVNSIPDKFKDDPLSCAYTSNLEEMILKYKPKYLIHGHIHTPQSYKIGQTQIICNPHGYINEPYNGYDRELMIEL